MDDKINGSVYHKFINNYQKPVLISKKDSTKIHKEILNKKNTVNSFHSKLIYVNKKNINIPINTNQIDISSDIKSFTNSERMLTPHQTHQKYDKNDAKLLLNDIARLNSICNGLPVNPKKRKAHQSVNNDANKLNSKSMPEEDSSISTKNNSNIFKNKNNEILSNTMQKLKKINTNITNLSTNGKIEPNNKLINSYLNNNKNEPKRKKNFSLNYNNDANLVSNSNKNKSKEKGDILEYDYLINSNKINERKRNIIRENINSRELSKLIQENFNFDFHRKFNNYTDFNKNNSVLTNNHNIMVNSRINNSIDGNCNFTENYKRETPELKDEYNLTNKTCEEEEKIELPKKSANIKHSKNKNIIFNNNAQKKEIKDLQQKLSSCFKKIKSMEIIQKKYHELEKQNEELKRKMGIVKKKNELFISQIEELKNISADYSKKIQQMEVKLRAYQGINIQDGAKNDRYKNLEIQYKIILEKNNKISNEFGALNKEIKELKEIKNKYNILIKEHGSLLKTESLYNEIKMKYEISENKVKTLTNQLNIIENNYKKQKEEIELINNQNNKFQDYSKLIEEKNNLKKINEFLTNKNKELEEKEKSLLNNNKIPEDKEDYQKKLEIQSNINNLSYLNNKKKLFSAYLLILI